MTSPIVVSIPHQLGKDEAVRRLRRGIASTATLPMLRVTKEEWAGHRLAFSLSGLGRTIHGSADVSDTSVRIEIDLPMFLQRMATAVTSVFRQSAQKLLEKK